MRFSSCFPVLSLLAVTILGQALSPFSVDGALDDAQLDPTCLPDAVNCGGTVSVNGFTITIPKNTLLAFPAAFIPFKQVVDNISKYRGLEVGIDGNLKGNQHIAGLFSISQFMLETSAGHIASVNDDGRITIVNGPTIRINDPNGVYSVGYKEDPFFTADDENPSISAFSGFPMCVPRGPTDDLCPQSNRPLVNGVPSLLFEAPDPLIMAPFKAGDYISFSGRKVGNEIICFGIVAENVQITTKAGTVPTYIRMEDAIVGVYDPALVGAVEFADTRFIGMLSDATASVSIFALDVDPCTGEEKERLIGNAVPKAGDIRNKFTWRADSTTLGHYTREYIIKANSGQKLTKNGITAGQYVQPVTEWIMPEADIPGNELPALSFGQFDHLTKAFGPFVGDNPTIFGPLNPYPGPTQPADPVCDVGPVTEDVKPIADAGADQSLAVGSLVTLSGSNTNTNLANGNLNFAWTLTTGPALTGTNALKNPTSPTANYVAPRAAGVWTFTLQICVKDAQGASITTQCSTDSVQITTKTTTLDVVTVDTFSWQSSQSGTLSVTCHSSVVDGTVTSMRLTGSTLPAGGSAMTAVASTPGAFTFQARSIKLPTSVTCKSNIGGSATKSQTTQ